MLNKVKHIYTDSSLTLRMTGSVNMYIIPIFYFLNVLSLYVMPAV